MSTSINNGGPAFPTEEHAVFNGREGMTLRDYFAARAMQAFLTHADAANSADSIVAGWAYNMADAMLKAREV